MILQRQENIANVIADWRLLIAVPQGIWPQIYTDGHGLDQSMTSSCLKEPHTKIDSRPPTNVDHSKFKHGAITQKIIGVFFEVYNELGHGFLESVYGKSLELALNSTGLNACRKIEIPVLFRGHSVGDFEADMLVNNLVLLELKTARVLDSSHEAQLLNYLRATEIEVGLLLNFGLRPQFKRLVFDNPRKAIRANPCLSVADLLAPDQ